MSYPQFVHSASIPTTTGMPKARPPSTCPRCREVVDRHIDTTTFTAGQYWHDDCWQAWQRDRDWLALRQPQTELLGDERQ